MERKYIGIIAVVAIFIVVVMANIERLTEETPKEIEVIKEQIPTVEESVTNEGEVVEKTSEEILEETPEKKQEIITETFEEAEEKTAQLPIITLSSIGYNAPETDPVLEGRAKLYITLNKIYPSQRFSFYKKDTPVDKKVGDFYISTDRFRCILGLEGRYDDCKHTAQLPLDGKGWITGEYYVQAKAKVNDPDGEYKTGDPIGDKAYFNYIK